MTAQADPYVRVYYGIVDDPRFATVYGDDQALATWLRLLLVADATHPASAPIPRWCRKRPLATLVDVGLVDLLPGEQFRIHGLSAERERRSAQAKNAADTRWNRPERMRADSGRMDGSDAGALLTHSSSNATASGPAMHSELLLSEPLRATPLRATPRRSGREHGSKDRKSNGKWVATPDGLTHVTEEEATNVRHH